MSKTHFYITTPIYYANAAPHIGNAYTSFIADVYARMHRLLWYHVKFTTGTDENGQKMLQTAEREGKEVMQFLDEIAALHRQTWDSLQISYTDFIRTTEKRHYDFVQQVLQKTFDAGDIYQGEYDGLYCIGCEAYKKPSDLTSDGLCPDHLKKPEVIKENNRFFRLSKYQGQLLKHYNDYPDFCIPSLRFNEVKTFVNQWLEDFSISRQGSSFGIKFPDSIDPDATVYIWFDALYNYITSCQWWDEVYRSKDCEKVHTIGKDISRFHAIYRPAMLRSAGYDLPDMEIINGFFTVDGQKMSKSLGNSLDPLALVEEYERDALVYYLFADIHLGSDGDFSRDRLVAQKDSNLKNGWSNLVNRVVSILKKAEVKEFYVHNNQLFDIIVYCLISTEQTISDSKLFSMLMNIQKRVENNGVGNINATTIIKKWYFDEAKIAVYLSDRYQIVGILNAYIASTEPWKAIKVDKEGTIAQLQAVLFVIKYLGIMISPFLIEGTERLKDILCFDQEDWKSFNTIDIVWDTKKLETLLSFTSSQLVFGEWYIYS